jgi:hypothetical protein
MTLAAPGLVKAVPWARRYSSASARPGGRDSPFLDQGRPS